MFKFWRWFQIRRDLDTDRAIKILADRVYDRLPEIKDMKFPLRALQNIAIEEAEEQGLMKQLQETVPIREMMHVLPARQRSILLDHIDRNLNYREIARERKLTERIVMRELVCAYSTLQQQMRDSNERTTQSP